MLQGVQWLSGDGHVIIGYTMPCMHSGTGPGAHQPYLNRRISMFDGKKKKKGINKRPMAWLSGEVKNPNPVLGPNLDPDIYPGPDPGPGAWHLSYGCESGLVLDPVHRRL